ncbi:MAG: Mfa1 fimbrilin C-terminal domain-containing protein [Bacteroidales bacterium]|nr:Mfa1 fimbrilin C-terminal domain-containing protein [Bacteroidales bacterium]
MKKQFSFSMLAGAAMLASCSSENVVAPENGAGNEYGLVEGQPSFISVGIAMPGGGQTRANEDFNDGLASEYKVFSGHLVLFKGTDEANATLFGSYDIKSAITSWTAESRDEITTSSNNFVQEIKAPKLSGSQKLYAYVILNDEDNATGIDFTPGQTFTAFSTQALKAIGIGNETDGFGAMGSKGLVMTNTPISTTRGGTVDPTGAEYSTLAAIDPSAVFPTEAAALAAPASQTACIYVERAAVKVEVDWNTTIADPAGSSTAVAFAGWTLGNVNNADASGVGYYNTRQVLPAWTSYTNTQVAAADAERKYRFVSNTPFFLTEHTLGYRTYWAQDPNYDGKTGLKFGKAPAASHTLGKAGVVYTYENTFDENSQIYANTTYVSFKTTINNGATFYTIAAEPNTSLSDANLKNKLASLNDANHGTEIAAVASTIVSKIDADRAGVGVAATGTIVVKLGHTVALTGSRDAAGKRTYTDKLAITSVTVDDVEVYAGAIKTAIDDLVYGGGKTVAETLDQDLAGIAYTPETVYEYLNGVSYYTARIAHFGDTETPWSAPDAAANIYDQIYPSAGSSTHTTPIAYGTSRAAAWLGRWGVVRNNWYSLTVSDIEGIGDAEPKDYSAQNPGQNPGDPTDPDYPGDTPDDNPKPHYFIKAHIHILPWVKRTQNVIL